MNWKLIFQLSLLGLIMAFGTISLIPQALEWPFWLVIFVFCAYRIANVCAGRYFLHGFFTSLFNCFWILFVHLLFFKTFMQHHPMSGAGIPPAMSLHPRLVMIVFGLIIGVVSGLVLGLFAFVASKIFPKNAPVNV